MGCNLYRAAFDALVLVHSYPAIVPSDMICRAAVNSHRGIELTPRTGQNRIDRKQLFSAEVKLKFYKFLGCNLYRAAFDALVLEVYILRPIEQHDVLQKRREV